MCVCFGGWDIQKPSERQPPSLTLSSFPHPIIGDGLIFMTLSGLGACGAYRLGVKAEAKESASRTSTERGVVSGLGLPECLGDPLLPFLLLVSRPLHLGFPLLKNHPRGTSARRTFSSGWGHLRPRPTPSPYSQPFPNPCGVGVGRGLSLRPPPLVAQGRGS